MRNAIAIAACLVATASAEPKTPFPDEVAGFRFGIAPAEFAAQCKQLGKPSALAPERDGMKFRTCDAVEVQPGWRWSVFAAFCDNDSRLCEIQYYSKNRLAPRDFAILRDRFTRRFGPADETKGSLANDALDCTTGDGRKGHAWSWRSPDRRALLVYECRGGGPFLGATFSDPSAVASHLAHRKAGPPPR